MSLLTLLAPPAAAAAAPITLTSATVLANGTTLRLSFSQPIVSGNPTAGLSRSTGSISSGTISDGFVDLTIPKVYAGDSVGTISGAAGLMTIAGASGVVQPFLNFEITNNAAAWTPAIITSNIDYGIWTDTARLFQNTDGTGAVSNTSPIGYWKGQRDVAVWTGTNKPVYNSSAGVHFLTTASKKQLLRSVSFPASQAQAYAICYELLTTGTNKGVKFGGVNAGAVAVECTQSGTDDSSGQVRGIRSTLTDNSHASTGRKRMIISYDPVAGYGYLYYNGTKTQITAGGNTTANATLYMEVSTNASVVIKGWAEFNDHISDADAARIDSWMGGL